MSDILSGVAGLVTGAVAVGGLAHAWRSGPRFRKPELHTIDITHSNWATPMSPVDFSSAPAVDAGNDAVDEWLFSQGGAPVSWYIKSVLFVGNAHSLVITGVTPEVRRIPDLVMRSRVYTQLGGNGYLRRRAYITLTQVGPVVKLFDDENNELGSFGLNLDKGDALEFMFCIEAENPGAAYEVSLSLELLVDGKKRAHSVADGRHLRVAACLPDGESYEYPGANMLY
ncbi:hypothetical protein [Streptomyces sp. NPDC050564]|uniref:hypothetical protein n=1 Tax=Streptomyces sp. NPDC050564 TaxID=3365631 RepID=UPI003797D10A